MIFGSVCAGIEAATKTCTKCGKIKTMEEFHRQGQGKRHCWCRSCFNSRTRVTRIKSRTMKRKHVLYSKYRLTVEQFQKMLEEQKSLCAICFNPMKRICIDHNHDTGKIRGLLCHGCNIKLSAVENADYHTNALKYLEAHSENKNN